MSARPSWLATCGLALVLTATARAGVEKAIDLTEVPEAILELARSKLRDPRILTANTQTDPDVSPEVVQVALTNLTRARLVSANTETEDDGSFVYEIQGVLHDGRRVEVDIEPEGAVLEVEVEFRKDQVPGAVLEAIERKLPGFEPVFIEASHSASFKVVAYEFVGNFGGAEIDIEVSADGRRIEIGDR